MDVQFAEDPAYVQYEAHLLALAKLMSDGHGDTDEAEALRDQMDDLYWQLTKVESERLSLLSADLYMIEDKELLLPADRPYDQFVKDLSSAARQGYWEYALVLLRKRPPNLQPKFAAYYRAQAYDGLGHTSAGLVFSEYLVKLEPGNVAFTYLWRARLRAAGRFEEAVIEAEKSLSDPEAAPELRLMAGAIFFDMVRDLSETAARSIYQRIVTELEPLTMGLITSTASLPDRLDLALQSGILTVCMSLEELNQITKARNIYDMALLRYPGNAFLLASRGLLLIQFDRDQALADFRKVASIGSPSPSPYVYLAQDAILSGDFQLGLAYCEQVLAHPRSNRLIKAQAMSWLAICHHELGATETQVRQELEEASRLDPENQHIQNNLRMFGFSEAEASPSPNPERSKNDSQIRNIGRDWRSLSDHREASWQINTLLSRAELDLLAQPA